MPTVVYDPGEIDFESPGKRHYQVAFQLDGSWGSSLVPLTVVNGERGPNPNGVAVVGGRQFDIHRQASRMGRRDVPS